MRPLLLGRTYTHEHVCIHVHACCRFCSTTSFYSRRLGDSVSLFQSYSCSPWPHSGKRVCVFPHIADCRHITASPKIMNVTKPNSTTSKIPYYNLSDSKKPCMNKCRNTRTKRKKLREPSMMTSLTDTYSNLPLISSNPTTLSRSQSSPKSPNYLEQCQLWLDQTGGNPQH